MWSIIAASVVLLPLPVVPVTSTRPRSSVAISFRTRGQVQLVDRADLHRDDAEDHADGAALLEDVAAEAAEAGNAVGEVDFLGLLEFLSLGRRQHGRSSWRPRLRDRASSRRGPAVRLPRDAHHRVAADLQVKVGRAVIDGNFQKIIDVHASGTRGQRLGTRDNRWRALQSPITASLECPVIGL